MANENLEINLEIGDIVEYTKENNEKIIIVVATKQKYFLGQDIFNDNRRYWLFPSEENKRWKKIVDENQHKG